MYKAWASVGSQPRPKVKASGLGASFPWSSGWCTFLDGGAKDSKEGRTCNGAQNQVSTGGLPLSTSSFSVFAFPYLSLYLLLPFQGREVFHKGH